MTLTQTAPRQHADAAQIPADPLWAFIDSCPRRKQTPLQIVDAVEDTFGIEIDRGQVIPCWKGEIALSTQTEHRPDKESVQFTVDEPNEPLFTHMDDGEAAPVPFSIAPESAISNVPDPVSAGADADDAPATQTGHGQDAESPPDAATRTGHGQDAESPQDAATQTGHGPGAATQTGRRQVAESPRDAATQTGRRQNAESPQDAATQTGRRQDAESPPDTPTQTGRRQDQKTKSVLTDEIKEFIVRGLARYETPTHVAASVQAQFGIVITRRQVFAYDPAGSRPPAQRWIDLHAATRAKFLDAIAEIGIAQKVVRLRMLDRFANLADEADQWERACTFMVLAAKECGGFYDRHARPRGAAAVISG